MKKPELVFVVLALLGAVVFVFAASMRASIGFPLDDAWIHQVYARNLATRGEFAFTPGQSSAGSTSPLWALALAFGYILRMDFRIWSYLLGAVLLGASALFAMRLASHIYPLSRISPLLLPFFVLFEWHMAWSAVSGMEIPLFVFLSLLVLEQFYAGQRVWLIGLIAGALTLTRPEGAVLGALVALGLLVPDSRLEAGKEATNRLRALSRILAYSIGFAVLVVPYLAFNYSVSGTILPNTFYAKQTEYAILFESVSPLARWLSVYGVPFVGAQALLLPGLVFTVARLQAQKQWRSLIPFAWLLLLPALYALRLPVAYQHGRYEMPVVPLIGLYGIYGTAALLARLRVRVIRSTWALSTGVLLVLFWILGANAYSEDVAIIDCEMVQSARWVASNTEAGALVAAHDIGALGYYNERPVIDLAGLVSPEVIPFLRDEGRLRNYLTSRRATLAIFFPDWYPVLASDAQFVPVHRRDCPVARQAGGTDMIVYEIAPAGP